MTDRQVFDLCDRFHRRIVNIEQEYKIWKGTGFVPDWMVPICSGFLEGNAIDLGKAVRPGLAGGIDAPFDLEADANC